MQGQNNEANPNTCSAGKKATPAPKAAAASATSKKVTNGNAASQDAGLANGVSKLKVSDVPPPKSKGLDVVKEYEKSNSKKSISFVVVGKSLECCHCRPRSSALRLLTPL